MNSKSSKSSKSSKRLSGFSFSTPKSPTRKAAAPGPTQAPAKTFDTAVASGTQLQSVRLKLDRMLPEASGAIAAGGHLAEVVSKNTLPLTIRLKKGFSAKGSPISLKNGELLILCCLIDVPVIEATFSWDKHGQHRLPMKANQLYEKLPMDSALDDREYHGTKALIDARPFPKEVRIVDAISSPDPMAAQDVGDVITVSRVEVQQHPDRGKERVLIGYDVQAHEVHFSESMELSSYSTMTCPNPLPLSELIKFGVPQRARLVSREIDPKKEKDKTKHKIVQFNRYCTEHQVIAVRSKSDMIISIPVDARLEFDVVTDATFLDIAPLLPTIFSRTNFSWCLNDVLRTNLPFTFSAVPQPLSAVLEEWSQSYEGQQWVADKASSKLDTFRNVLSEKQQEIIKLNKRLALWTSPKPVVQPREATVRAGHTPPPLPPRQPDFRRMSLPPGKTNGKSWTKNHSETVYEFDELVTEKDSNQAFVKAQETIQSLKKELHEKNEEIFSLRMEKRKITDAQEVVVKERDGLKKSVDEAREEIVCLRNMIDNVHAADQREQAGGHIYDHPYSNKGVLETMPLKDTLEYLKKIGLENYCPIFERERIDGSVMVHLDEQIMIEDLGMRRIDARKLTTKIEPKK